MQYEYSRPSVSLHPSSLSRSNQRPGGLAVSTRRIGRPSGASNRVVVRVDPQLVIEHPGEVGGGDRAIDGDVASRVGPAEDQSGGRAGPEEQDAVGTAVMVAARVAVDLGRPAELAHHDDQRVVEQPAFGEILDQCGDALVQRRRQRRS